VKWLCKLGSSQSLLLRPLGKISSLPKELVQFTREVMLLESQTMLGKP
jgi:hypothetical protein